MILCYLLYLKYNMHIANFRKFNNYKKIHLEFRFNISKGILSGCYINFKSLRFMKYLMYKGFYKRCSSKSFFRRSCLYSGNCRSVFRKFKLDRYRVKHLGSYGFLTGLRRASF